MYPLDPQAKFDIDLLSEAADLVRSMPVRKMTAYEMSYMKLVNDFVAELIRLAHCAIAKATMELEQGQQNTPTGWQDGLMEGVVIVGVCWGKGW